MPSSAVQVVVRLRPMNENESKHGTLPVIKAKTEEKTVTVIKGQGSRQARSSYAFDNVFTAFSTQSEVFDATLKPMINDVMKGYESTVFAYGQTGTGKTHTMEGNLSSPEHYGIIPRSAQAIFEALKKPEFVSHHVVCTYLEIYNEDLCDLLLDDPALSSSSSSSSSSTPMKDRSRSSTSLTTPMKDRGSMNGYNHHKKLEIMNGKNGTFCRGLTEKEVKSASDVLDLMQRAQQLRKIGETKMNKESSRSHCVFTIIINANRRLNDGSTFEFSGKLHMVDLAGSECAKTAGLEKSTGSEVTRERERMNINRSLLTLGRVIQLLKEQSTSKRSNIRIPYRDSKLTRILQESLGGRCKTLIIATLSPSATAIEESTSTLNYAQAANGIVNKPVSSSYLSMSSSTSSSNVDSGLSEPNGVENWEEMECRLEYMQTQVEEAKAALARKHMQQQELMERAEKAESAVVQLENQCFEAREEISSLKTNLMREKEEKQAITVLLKQTEVTLKKTNAILEATQHTEVCLTSEAKRILNSLEESIKDSERLHSLLAEARNEDTRKKKATKEFHSMSVSILENVINDLDDLAQNSEEHQESMIGHVTNAKLHRKEMISSFKELLTETSTEIEGLSGKIISLAQGENGVMQTLSNMSSKVLSNVEQNKELVDRSESNLQDSFHNTRLKIMSCSDKLKDKNTEYLKCSEEVVSAFEFNIKSTITKLNEMVTKISEGLNQVRNAGIQTRTDLSSLMSQIEETSTAALTSTAKMSIDQREEINTTLESFNDGKEHLQTATTILDDQKSFMNTDGTEHLTQVRGLHQMISSQKAAFEEASLEQKRLQEEVLNNMFKGMHQLLQSEMNRIFVHNKEQQSSFNLSSEKMLCTNDSIGSSAQNLVEKVQKTNINLSEHVKSAQQNDDLLERTVQRSNSTLKKIVKIASDEQNTIHSHIEKALVHVDHLQEQEQNMTTTGETMAIQSKSIENYLSEHIQSTSRDGMNKMAQEGKSHIDYAKTVIVDISKDLHEMEAPRDEFCTGMIAYLDRVASDVREATKKIAPVVQEQCRDASAIKSANDSEIQNFKQISDSHCKNINIEEEAMLSHSKEYQANASSSLSFCQSHVSNARTAVSDFSIRDMKSEDIVPPLPAKTLIKYDPNLTSTPAMDTIIQGLDLGVNDETFDSMSDKSETSFQSSSATSSIQDPSPISESPMQRNSQVNANPSPLSELSLNKENIDRNISKPTKPGKKPIRQSKKRSSSKQRTELRNRIPTTPSRGGQAKRRRERI